MHRYLRFAILENLDTVRHIPVGRVWGVPVSVTPWIWLHPVVFSGLHLALGALGPRQTLAEALQSSVAFVVGVAVGTLVHALGHIVGGQLVRSPMDELLLTATRGVNLYHGDQSAVPGRVHLGRAVGGPALNLLFAGLLAAGLGWLLPGGVGGLLGQTLNSVVSTSLYIGLGGLLLPLPSVDGWVIWREVLRALNRNWKLVTGNG